MLGLSFDMKSNVPVFAMYLNAKILFTFYVSLLHFCYNIPVKQNVLHNFTVGAAQTSRHDALRLKSSACGAGAIT